MATLFNSSLRPDATIAANVQGWASWFELVVTNLGGWTVTSDTGQTLPSSLGGATGVNQKLGYRIYKMNDDFTTENPIYMRVDYGSASFNATTPTAYYCGIWISFGTGTDGSGNLTGLLWDGVGFGPAVRSTVYCNSNPGLGDANYPTRNYASGDTSRFVVGMFVTNAPDQICFSLERSRDANGIYTGDGILITYSDVAMSGGGGTAVSLSATKYLICNRGGRAQPLLERGLSFPFIRHSPAYSFNGTIPCAIHSHFRGVAQQPGTNTVIVGQNDLLPEGQFQFSLYGDNHVYQHLGGMVAARALGSPPSAGNLPLNDGGTRICIRYD